MLTVVIPTSKHAFFHLSKPSFEMRATPYFTSSFVPEQWNVRSSTKESMARLSSQPSLLGSNVFVPFL